MGSHLKSMRQLMGIMTIQTQLDGSEAEIEEAIVFYRTVKSEKRLKEPDRQIIDTATELSDVGELLEYIKDEKLDYPLPLSDSKMKGMRSDRVMGVFESKADPPVVKDLLAVFCESLTGSQRASDKYAMLVFTGESFLLGHVRAEKGMSISEEEGKIELIRRFLDVDNILSAALFEREQDGTIEFSHFTDSGSDSFRNFLGVNEHHLNYRRKTIQIICFYRKQREFECKFEFTKDELSDKWLRDEEIRLSGNKLRFTEEPTDAAPHEIKEIRWGKDTYSSVSTFKSEFKEQSLGLNLERDKYDVLMSYPSDSDSDISVFSAENAVDHRRKISLHMGHGRKQSKSKTNISDNYHIVYAGNHIDLSPTFAEDIFRDLANGKETYLFHAAEEPAAEPFSIDDVTFLNIERDVVTKERNKLLQELYKHANNRTGETLRKHLFNSFFFVLRPVVDEEFKAAIDQLIKIYSGNPANGDVISTKENEGPGIVEYKNRIHLENGDSAEKIVEEIGKERNKGNDAKVFLWGFTEQSRSLDGLNTQSWNDDRLTNIEERVQTSLNSSDIRFEEFLLQPVNLDGNGDYIAVVGIIF